MSKSKSAHWKYALSNILHDTSDFDIIKETEQVWVILDKYPKAMQHFLIIPKISIKRGVEDLKPTHRDLLKHMKRVAKSIMTKMFGQTFIDKDLEYLVGFHAIPSLYQLHLHVLTTDLSGIKTKKHRNSFSKEFMLSIDDVLSELDKFGKVVIDKKYYKKILQS